MVFKAVSPSGCSGWECRGRGCGSQPLDDGGDAHAAAHAQRGQAVAQLAPVQFIDQGAQDHRARGPQRVAQGNGAAIHIDLVVRYASSFMKRMGTAAKASLTSNRSIWSMFSPARARALRVAGMGPVSMMVGSAPLRAVATMRARGVRPCWRAASSEPISTAAAPSTMPEALPAWCTWLMRSTWG